MQLNEAAVRLGLALYKRTILEGDKFYSVFDLVFEEDDARSKAGFLRRAANKSDFWGLQQEAARILDGAGIARVQRKSIPDSAVQEYALRLTDLGRSLYAVAYMESDLTVDSVNDITPAQIATVLSNETSSSEIAGELKKLDPALNKLNLSNHQRATVDAYVIMLVAICEMPERDAKLFWLIVERLSQIAGVASLVVAIIAMRLAR
jgi:hypothetical protein